MHNNVALSLEIGSSSAVQICLLMLPILVGWSAIVRIRLLPSPPLFRWWAACHESAVSPPTHPCDQVDHDVSILMFPMFMVFAIIFAVIIVNYLSIEGKANYFKGCALVIVYVLFIVGLFFQ
jgi:Ca2+:H+ antiporter